MHSCCCIYFILWCGYICFIWFGLGKFDLKMCLEKLEKKRNKRKKTTYLLTWRLEGPFGSACISFPPGLHGGPLLSLLRAGALAAWAGPFAAATARCPLSGDADESGPLVSAASPFIVSLTTGPHMSVVFLLPCSSRTPNRSTAAAFLVISRRVLPEHGQ
jgi:hypothetical protein